MAVSKSLIAEVRANGSIPPPRVARAIRLAAGLSQERMAEELGIDRSLLARWELGERRPRGPRGRAYGHVLAALKREVGVRG